MEEDFREAGHAGRASSPKDPANGKLLKDVRLMCAFPFRRPGVFRSPLWKPSLQLLCGKGY